MTDPVLEEQIQYYRARAVEYDEWFYRQGRYDHGEVLNAQWFSEAEEVRQTLLGLPLASNALELACGTGIWTQELVKIADHVAAMDASPEMLAINRAKLLSSRVTYQQLDLFEWQPDGQYDLIFFGFWLSHVPPEMVDAFLGKVAQSLSPAGKVFMIDSRKEPTSTARDLMLPESEQWHMERTLNDGRSFRIIKVFYNPSELAQHFIRAGLQPVVRLTDRYFIWAIASHI